MSDNAEIKRQLAKLSDLMLSSSKIVFFTGAGISTESGIPDYRSPGGIWSQFKPITYQEFIASEAARVEDWRRRFVMKNDFDSANPNIGHQFITRTIGQGRATGVITQNIDGLHRRAGVQEKNLIELHGNGTFGLCLDCAKKYQLSWAKTVIEQTGAAPRCDDCGGLLKAAVVSFGQAMPETEMRRADRWCRSCDLFVVMGSSLQVYPAASLPVIAKENGARLIVINHDKTPVDPAADLIIHSFIGPILRRVSG
ncbi:MAG: Sir2 family NAD-dependent protein deacetylase [Stappiaceae bacterium]